jgi:predicted nucleic acid-binding protein
VIAVIDASVVVKWLISDPAREPDSDRALAVLDAIRGGYLAPLQPPHWLAEAAAAVSRLRPGFAGEAIDLLDAMEIPVSHEVTVYKRAAALAAQLNHHLFDTLYHALALEREALLISADRRYYNKAHKLGHIVYLADWE